MEVLKSLVDYGALGILAIILALAVRVIYSHARGDRQAADKKLETIRDQLSKEQALRVEDAKRFTEVALELQASVISAVGSIDKSSEESGKLVEVVEHLVDAVEDLLQSLPGAKNRRPRRRH